MLSQAVLAKYDSIEQKPSPNFTWTSVSPCEYETYINYHNLDKPTRVREAIELIRMQDGHYQEAQVVDQLRYAGFELRHTGKNQLALKIGRAGIPGHPDGLILVDTRWDMLEVKARSLNEYTLFVQKGLVAFPRIKVQVQGYMSPLPEQERCWVYFKHKDSCRPHDVPELKDPGFIDPIIAVTDAIILDGYKPEPVKTVLCSTCRHNLFCWGAEILDLSGIKVVSLPEAVSKWKEGKWMRDYGGILNEEARDVFKEALGDNELLIVDDLKIQRIISMRTEISISKFTTVFGANRLPEVLEERQVEQMRVTEIT